jgi:hypothetical protein
MPAPYRPIPDGLIIAPADKVSPSEFLNALAPVHRDTDPETGNPRIAA